MKWRITFLIFGFGVFYFCLSFYLYNIQINKNGEYIRIAQMQTAAGGVLDAPRGSIFFTDKNNNQIPVAMNKSFSVIYAVPDEIQKSLASSTDSVGAISEKLSVIIGKTSADIEKQLLKKNDQYELLLQKADDEIVSRIQALGVKGVYVVSKTLRYYPTLDLAAHLLGFVSPANDKESTKYGNAEIGRYGIELSFNDTLSGKPGEVDGDNLIEPSQGGDVRLTIDRNIQSQAEDILKNLISQYNSPGGTVIVEEPSTGKILAMGNYPDFDPNSYSKYEIKNFLNPATQAVYEPGSVFKILTMAAGIDSGKITPSTTYYDVGSFTANNMTISNWDFKTHGPYGRVTMTNVIEHSINTGAVFAERKTGNDIFRNYVAKFGLGDLTGIELPGEVRGNQNNLKKGKDIDFATASYGQGVSVTPIALISAVSAIANNGVLMKPCISYGAKPVVVRRVISEDTSRAVRKMMVLAVEKNVLADIPNYSVAGKTGTAFVPNFGGKGYTEKVINTYVGFAPAFDPKFVILIKLNEPEGNPLAGQTVVPAFKDLAQYLLNYYNIPPDQLVQNSGQ
ncbi:MAG: penicillin-binding protein 2 [Candidatus Wolfebacteria bacterium]|nr:penicillin-binding protein 2 [Candidatus Wolfebacteria bacterium]